MHLPSYYCVLCHLNVEEYLTHLFLHCPFSIACWWSLQVTMPNSTNIFQIMESIKSQLLAPFFMDVIVTMCWAIWSSRNDKIFRGIDNSIRRCKEIFKQEFAQVILRAKSDMQPSMKTWLQAYV